MTRDEMIAKALPKITGAAAGDVALLGMASTGFLEKLATLAGNLGGERRYDMFDEEIPGGRLHAHADAMPGITVHLVMSGRISYQMGSVWALGVRLPQTLADGIVGRPIHEVVELPRELPAAIREERIHDIFHAGNRKNGYNTRFDLERAAQTVQ